MTLIKCVECGKQISDQARCCVHCGYEFPKAQPIQPQPVQQYQQSMENTFTKEQQDIRSNTIVLLSINAIITIIVLLFMIYTIDIEVAKMVGALYTIPLGLSFFPIILPIANLITPDQTKGFHNISIGIVIANIYFIIIICMLAYL